MLNKSAKLVSYFIWKVKRIMVLLRRVNIRWSTLSYKCCRNAWSETWNNIYYFLHFCSCITIKFLNNHTVSFVFHICFMWLQKSTFKVTLSNFQKYITNLCLLVTFWFTLETNKYYVALDSSGMLTHHWLVVGYLSNGTAYQ